MSHSVTTSVIKLHLYAGLVNPAAIHIPSVGWVLVVMPYKGCFESSCVLQVRCSCLCLYSTHQHTCGSGTTACLAHHACKKQCKPLMESTVHAIWSLTREFLSTHWLYLSFLCTEIHVCSPAKKPPCYAL